MARILIAEDNPVTAEMMDVRLTSIGHEVVRANDGRMALERLQEGRPDLILLDMMMPDVDGAQFLQHMKADALMASIPVVVVSARSREEDILAALAAGVSDYLTKPFSLRELVARVDRTLAEGPQPLQIAVQGADSEVALGDLLRADARGTSVAFPSVGAPRFAVGERVKLSLRSPGLPQAIELHAQATSRGESAPQRTYGFRFDADDEVQRDMAQALLDLIGRRGAYRVSLEDEPTDVRVLAQSQGESREFLGTLLDISSGGIRLLLKGNVERHLSVLDYFEVRFVLPGGDVPLTLNASIRHRMLSEEGVMYGTRFEPDLSPDFLEQQEQISEFVLGRVD